MIERDARTALPPRAIAAPTIPPPRRRGRRGPQGFSLIEVLVTLAVFGVVLILLLNIFDSTTRLTSTQLQISELQQSHRIAQQELVKMARMAGRGGLSTSPPLDQTNAVVFPQLEPASAAPAVEVIDNAPAVAAQPALGWPYTVRPGTDTLIVRGVFTSPLYAVNSWDPAAWNDAGRSVTVDAVTPAGRIQNLQPLIDAVNAAVAAGPSEAIVLVSAMNQANYGVALLTGGAVGATSVTLTFTDSRVLGAPRRALDYGRLSSNAVFPSMVKVAYVGLLEEYRYYVRDTVGLNGQVWPVLSRARVYPMPTTQSSAANPVVPWANAAVNLQDDFAEGLFDLQIAAGFDSSLGGRFFDDANNDGPDDQIVEAADGRNDDWLFNAAADNPAATPWVAGASRLWTANASTGLNPQPTLYYLRLSTLTRTERQDANYTAPLLQRLENHDLTLDTGVNGAAALRCRRQVLQTTVDLRNAA